MKRKRCHNLKQEIFRVHAPCLFGDLKLKDARRTSKYTHRLRYSLGLDEQDRLKEEKRMDALKILRVQLPVSPDEVILEIAELYGQLFVQTHVGLTQWYDTRWSRNWLLKVEKAAI